MTAAVVRKISAGRYRTKEIENFHAYSRRDRGGWILFLNTTLINHSCAPNAFVDLFKKESGETWCEVRAIKDISKGEEVTVFYEVYQDFGTSYLVYGCNAQERRMEIKKMFKFYCKCAVCSGNVPEQEDVIKELLKLQKVLYKSRKKPSNLALEVKTLNKIVGLNLRLYIGSGEDKIWSMQGLGLAAERAGNKDLMKKASDGLKKLTEDWKIDRLVRWCKMREKVCKEEGLEF